MILMEHTIKLQESWNIGNLSNGSSLMLNIITRVNSTATIKTIVNKSAQIENDPNSDNNAQETIITVPKSVDVSVKTYPWYYDYVAKVYLTQYAYGTPTVMIVDVRNSVSYGDASGVVVEYKIGDGLKYIDCYTRGIGTTQYSNGVLTWNIGDLPAGGMLPMYVFLEENKTGNMTFSQNLTASLKSVDQTDVNAANNKANRLLDIVPSADVQVTQTVSNSTPNYNSNVIFTITVRNNGPNDVNGVQIKDTFT